MNSILIKLKRQGLRFAITIITAVAVFGFTACGGGGNNKTGGNPPSDNSNTTLSLSGSDTGQTGESFTPKLFRQTTSGITGSDTLSWTQTAGGTTNKTLQALGTADGIELVLSFLSTGEFEEISFLFRSGSELKGYSCDAADCSGTVVRDSSLKTITFNNLGVTVSNSKFGPTNSATETLILNGTISATSSTPPSLDITGSWKITTTVVLDECDSADPEIFTVEIVLKGNEVTMTVPPVGVESGFVQKGTMQGDEIIFESSGFDDEGPDTWTELITLTVNSSGSSFTGENDETQAGPNGENPCPMKTIWSGTRV